MNSVCRWLDELDEDRHAERNESDKISVNLAQESVNKRVETPEKYGPASIDRSKFVKFEEPRGSYRVDNQSARGRGQFRGGYRGRGGHQDVEEEMSAIAVVETVIALTIKIQVALDMNIKTTIGMITVPIIEIIAQDLNNLMTSEEETVYIAER